MSLYLSSFLLFLKRSPVSLIKLKKMHLLQSLAKAFFSHVRSHSSFLYLGFFSPWAFVFSITCLLILKIYF